MNELTIKTLAPTTLAEAKDFCVMLAKSTFIPKDYQGKPENVLVALQWGYELGIQPLQALQSIAVINGRPSIYGDLALALVKSHPDYEWIKEEQTENQATCIIKRKGSPEHKSVFTLEDAKRANLWGKQGPWTQYPRRMLQMRARGFAIRDTFPDALRGLITREEAEDYPTRNVTPTYESPAETHSIIEENIKPEVKQSIEIIEKLYEKEPEQVKEEETPPPPKEEQPEETPKEITYIKPVNLAIAKENELMKYLGELMNSGAFNTNQKANARLLTQEFIADKKKTIALGTFRGMVQKYEAEYREKVIKDLPEKEVIF